MHEIKQLLNKANQLFKTADHIAYVTYPLLKDNKLIITIIENLSEAMNKAMEAVIYYEIKFKRINYFPADFKAQIETFKLSASHYNINRNYIVLMQDLHDIIARRKTSRMEFVKNDKFVIWNNDYEMITLNYDKIKGYLNQSKPFFDKVNYILKNVNIK